MNSFWKLYKSFATVLLRPPMTLETVGELFESIVKVVWITICAAINLVTLVTFPIAALIITLLTMLYKNLLHKRKLWHMPLLSLLQL